MEAPNPHILSTKTGQIADTALGCACLRGWPPSRQGHANHGAERRLSIEQAKARVEEWEAMRDDFEWQASLEARFREASPQDVIRMWETGRNEKGRPLSKFEAQALAERWCVIF